jgi:hypothetical protein
VQKSVRELIGELAQVEDEIRLLTVRERGGMPAGYAGSVPTSSGWIDSHSAELHALRARADELCRLLRVHDSDEPDRD